MMQQETAATPPSLFNESLVGSIIENETATDNQSAIQVQTSDDEYWKAMVKTSKFYIEGLGILGIGGVGLFINVFALYILFRKQVMRNFHMLMCCLAVYDFLHLILDIGCFALPEFSSAYKNNVFLHAIPYVIPITQITLTGSCYTTIAITIERFLSIRHPFFIQRHNIKARMFVLPVLLYAIAYNVPRFFEFEVKHYCSPGAPNATAPYVVCSGQEGQKELGYALDISGMRKNKLYIMIYVNTMNLLFNMVVPFLTMGVMNYMIYRAMNRTHLRRRANGAAAANANGGPARFYSSATSRRFVALGRQTSSFLRRRNEGGQQGNNGQNLRRSCENVLRKREARITRASIAITVMFVVCHLPRCVPNVMEMFWTQQQFPKWLPILVSINHLLIAVNSAFNFLFYLSYCWGRKKLGRGRSSCLGGNTGTTNTATEWDDMTENGISTNRVNSTLIVQYRTGNSQVQFLSMGPFDSLLTRRCSSQTAQALALSGQLSFDEEPSPHSTSTGGQNKRKKKAKTSPPTTLSRRQNNQNFLRKKSCSQQHFDLAPGGGGGGAYLAGKYGEHTLPRSYRKGSCVSSSSSSGSSANNNGYLSPESYNRAVENGRRITDSLRESREDLREKRELK